MRSHPTLVLSNPPLLWLVLACMLVCPAAAQNFVPPSPVPPDLSFLPGLPAGQIESVNPLAGNLTLSFPVGSLPPGPGGFTTSVNLTYNSAFYTSYVDDNGSGGTQLRIMYQNQPSAGWNSGTWLSGGWSYSFRYNLWSASMPMGATPGNTMYLTTPDGAHHLLLLVSAVKPDGNPASSTFHQNYPNQPVYDINFAGLCTNSGNSACTQGRFNGTLVFASADSSDIRVESDTVNKTWAAYFADGTKVSGNFDPLCNGQPCGTIGDVLAAEWNKIEDRNGNTLNLTNFCIESSTCTTRITDQYGREVDIEYGSMNNFPWNWTDTISQPGVNGRVQTVVNWIMNSFSGPSYDCVYRSAGNFTTCPLTGANGTIVTPYVVESIQLPSGTTNGPSTVYTFNYDVPAGSSNWGELHTMKRKELISGTDVSPCLTTSASCPQQYQVDYTYYFDNPSRKRVMGTLVNPVSTKVLTYSENRDGTPTPLTETTSYSIPVPASFDPTKPSPVGGTSTITAPDGSQTTIYSGPAPSCTNAKSGLCPAFVYKVVNPDGTQTETAWTSSAVPPGTPSGAFVNPYALYTALTFGTKANGTSAVRDFNGNTTYTGEYDWFSASLLTRTSGVINGIPGSPTRTTSSTFYATTEYWNQGTRYLRALNTTSVGAASTTSTYDNPLTTANLTQQSSWNSETNSNISRSWTYTLPSGAVNGNVVTETDPNGIVTKTTYDASNLYPTQVDVAFGRTEKRTTKPTYDFNSGILLSSTDDNNHVTVTNTYDNLGRPKKVEQSGTGLYRSTSTNYDDVGLSSTATQDQTALASTTHYDPLGRVRLSVDAAGAKIQKAYRAGASGVSYELESNPDTTIDATMGWTLTTRNAFSAIATVQTYKGADPPAPWGSALAANLTGTTTTTAYDHSVATCSGPTANVTDPSNSTTKYCQDGLGRMAGVTDAAGNLTQYSYDLLDNLTKVTQSGQTRAFEYSSLGRLLKACNPETGTASCTASPLPDTGLEKYTYDAGGNLKTKKDARSITATYSGYDGLNRPQTVAYTKSDGTPEGTPTVTWPTIRTGKAHFRP
jgi:YD repeat-containing protein